MNEYVYSICVNMCELKRTHRCKQLARIGVESVFLTQALKECTVLGIAIPRGNLWSSGRRDLPIDNVV